MLSDFCCWGEWTGSLSNTVADNFSLSSTDVDGSNAKNQAFLSNFKVVGI